MNEFETDVSLPAEDVAELHPWTLEETDYELEQMRLGHVDDH